MSDEQQPSGESTMSTPAILAAEPAAYGERQAQPVSTSEGVMDNLSRPAREDTGAGRARAKAALADSLSRLELQYEMQRTRLVEEHDAINRRFSDAEAALDRLQSETVKMMDSFLNAAKTASLTVVELLPPPRVATPEEHVARQKSMPQFLDHQQRLANDRRLTVTPLRQPLLPVIAATIVVLLVIGVGVVVSRAQERNWGSSQPGTQLGAQFSSIPNTVSGIDPDGKIRPIYLDREGRVLAACGG